ncbi:ROK family protein [Alkalihalobacillus sp. NPDC078783]
MSHLISKLSREQMRTFNQKVILRLLKEHTILSRSQLSKLSKLTVPAVSEIVKTLGENQLISEEVTLSNTSRGRHPAKYQLKTDGIHIIAVIIASSYIKASIVDLNGQIKKLYQISLPPKTSANQALSYLQMLVKQCQPEQYKILGLGVGLHGIVNTDEGLLVFPPQLSWRNFPILSKLEELFHYPILIDNDCNAMVLAERWLGCAKEGETTVTLNVDYGIGVGIYVNNSIFRGSHYAAGQIGHNIIKENGPVCPCGNKGCLEMFASESSILQQLIAEVKSGVSSIATEIAGDIDSIKMQHLYESAMLNDTLSCSIISKAGTITGKEVSSLVNILNPDRIILTGGILRSENIFFLPFKQSIFNHSINANIENLNILKSSLGEHGDVIGAASLWIDKLFNHHETLKSLNLVTF